MLVSYFDALMSYVGGSRIMSLSERARTGLREMPSNAAWLLSRVRQPVDAAIEAAPVGGDSVETRMKRAREAAERAREAEDRAIEAARESKERSEHAREVTERGRARLAEVDRETSRHVKQRTAEAQKAADDWVQGERQAAEADAEEQQEEVQAEVDEEIEDAQSDADEARERAEELVEEATERLAEARRLADEGAEAARAAAEEARRQAEQLASEAEQQANDAEAQISAAEELREHSKSTAKHAARQLGRTPSNGGSGLRSHNKPELLELAASIGIEGRSHMSKSELVDAIAKASRSSR
jgi:colicin import membrane protein